MTSINITERLRKGRQIDREQHKEGEVHKLGTLRAGTGGIMADNGDVAGGCVRKAHLRSLGIEIEEPDDGKLIMFQLGYANEDVLYKDLIKTSAPDEVLLREEEIPIEWQTSNGTRVTGRPDVVICSVSERESPTAIRRETPAKDTVYFYKPEVGLELKSVHSVWVARDVLFGKQPKLTNLIQAGHYMWKLGIPYRLIYKGYSSLGQGMAWSDKMASMFPRQGEPGSEWMEYNDRGKPKQVKQFEVVYELELDRHGRIMYREENATGERAAPWKKSLATTADIERYYEYVSQMESSKQLGPRPLTLDAHGSRLNYTDCSYCPLQETCDKYEDKGYDTWLKQVRKLAVVK